MKSNKKLDAKNYSMRRSHTLKTDLRFSDQSKIKILKLEKIINLNHKIQFRIGFDFQTNKLKFGRLSISNK